MGKLKIVRYIVFNFVDSGSFDQKEVTCMMTM